MILINFIIIVCALILGRVIVIIIKDLIQKEELQNNKFKIRKCIRNSKIFLLIIQIIIPFLYFLIFYQNGYNKESIIYCLFTTALLLLSTIDFLTYEIPIQINLFIGALGIINVITDPSHIISYLIGFFCVSGFLYIIYIITKGKGIGGGDIKLMAVSGLILGFPNIIAAFLLGCILGSIIHTIRCKVSKANHVLAFGPYLSVGLFLSLLYGDQIISWYLSLF